MRPRLGAALLALALGTSPLAAGEPLTVRASALPVFDRAVPDNGPFGPLTYLGGLVLDADGGGVSALSGLAIYTEGGAERLVIVTDEGYGLTATLAANADGVPLGLSGVTVTPLADTAGVPLLSKITADFEGVTVRRADAGWQALVVAERNQPVRAYALGPQGFEGPASLPFGGEPPLPHGRADGLEAITHVSEGPLAGQTLVFLENEIRPASAPNAARILPDGTVIPFEIRRMDRYAITGAAMLPGGDVVIVERYFRWEEGIFMRLRHLPAAEIAAGAAQGRILMEADGATVIDNMEAVAVTDHPAGPILTLLSDDNGNFFQRTVLLRFQLTGDVTALARPLTPPAPVPRPAL